MSGAVEVTFDGELSGIKDSLDGLTSYVQGWGSKIAGIGAAAFAFVGVEELLGYGKEFINAATEAAQINAKLAAVLEASGHAAGFSAEELSKMATSLEHVTLFNDEAVKGAETMIATFSEIRGDEFERTTKLALDMATIMGGDASSAASELGKALNDPLRGMQLLQRQGVLLTDAQQKHIETMVKSGDVAGAQGILLDELGKKYGGAAEAAAGAAGGGFKQLANIGHDLEVALGTGLLAAIDPLMPLFKEGAELVEGWAESFKEMGPVISDVVNKYLKVLSAEFMVVEHVAGEVLNAVGGLWEHVFGNSMGGTIDKLVGVVDGLWDTIIDGAGDACDFIDDAWSASLGYVGDLWETVFGETAADSLNRVLDFAKDVFSAMVDFGVGFFSAMEVEWQNIPETAAFAWNAMKLGAVTTFEELKYLTTEVAPELVRWFADNWRDIFRDMFNFTKTIFSNMATNIGDFFGNVWSWLSGGETDFRWTDLEKGFKATLKELPNIAERELSPLEKELQEKTGNIGADLMGKFQAQNAKNRAALGLDDTAAPQFDAGAGGGTDADGKPKAGKKAPARADRSGDGQDDKGSKSAFEDLGALFKRIQSSAAGSTPEAKAATKTADAAEQTRDHTREAKDKLGTIEGHLQKIAANTSKPNIAVLGP